jgi:hypothetical protein
VATERGVVEPLQHRADVPIARGGIVQWLELDAPRAVEKQTHLLQRADLSFVHVDHHAKDDRPAPHRSP